MTSIYFHFIPESTCSFERSFQPVRFCFEELKEESLELMVGQDLQPGCDWVVYNGLPTMEMLLRVQRIKNRGSKILWSIDDDFTTIPDWNPAKPNEDALACFEIAKRNSDMILCSTEHLRTTFSNRREVHCPVVVAPNLMDLSIFPTPEYEQGNPSKAVTLPVRIVWVGGKTHKGDVEILEPVIRRILSKFGPERAYFVFMGLTPPPNLMRDYLYRGLLWQPPVPFAQYRKTANSINPDIWLAPQAPIEFNKSKSSLRVMEGWCMDSAVVASAWGEYNCIHHGYDGLTCSTEDDWFEALNELILDHEKRIQMAADGRQRIKAKYNWLERSCREPWLNLFRTMRDY